MKIECGIRLANDAAVFDRDCARLLEAIDRSGSMHQAAGELGISASWAWRTVKTAERGLGIRMLQASVGGRGGGGSCLTPEGRELLDRYSAARAELERYSAGLFERHFSDWDVSGDHPPMGEPGRTKIPA